MSAILSGWSAVAAIALVLIVLAVAACVAAMRGIFSTLATAGFSFPAMWLLAKYVFGDASVYLPHGMFSGADGKDQIIIVSILCTVLGGIILSAGFVWITGWVSGAGRAR